jgi:predicted alpha/beta superfamily hydrolase
VSDWAALTPSIEGESTVSLWIKRRVLSPELRNFRDLVVALPPSYQSGTGAYPVVYMQDGQNLFDRGTSFAGDWHLGPILTELASEGHEAIVVGIANMGVRRLYEYSPFRDPRHGGGGGDRYLAFVSETVKPLIDRSFRTRSDPADTVILGSSMGGLISLYALYRNPDIFGAAGVMSPALWFAGRSILRYARQRAAPAGRIHLDIGLREPGSAVADTRSLRNILAQRGLRPGAGLEYVEDEAGTHAEEAWGRRFRRALPFLLGATS